jgi:hypothetical protein
VIEHAPELVRHVNRRCTGASLLVMPVNHVLATDDCLIGGAHPSRDQLAPWAARASDENTTSVPLVASTGQGAQGCGCGEGSCC